MSIRIHPDTTMGTVKLKVGNLKQLVTFYQEVIGLKVLKLSENKATLTADGIKPLLILEEIPNAIKPRTRSTAGLYHFAILVPSREQLGLSLQRLIQSGIRIGQADHDVSEALYISDPEGNGIEIYADRPRASWKKDAAGNLIMGTESLDWDGLLEAAGDQVWTGLPAETRIGHVHLHVSDLQQAKAFYCDLLGFEMMVDGAGRMGALFISAGGYHHHLGLNIWAGAGAPQPPHHATGLAYYTIHVPSQSELTVMLDRLRLAGVSVLTEEHAWIVHDPSGNAIRLEE